MRLLIADDDAVSRRVLEATLTKSGYEVVACEDGCRAWQVLQGEDAPKVAILDWRMTGMDGVQVCQKVRETAQSPPPYIILLTGRMCDRDAVARLNAGADDYIMKPFDPEELHARVQAGVRVVELQRRLADHAEELEEQRRQLEQLSHLDHLTGLYNRRHFLERLTQETLRTQRYRSTSCILMLDVDGFKRVNDTYGRLMGDAVLATVASILHNTLRATDIAGRYGGEEFCMVLTETNIEGARNTADRLRRLVEAQEFRTDEGGTFHVTCSIGVAHLGNGFKNATTVLEMAGRALCKAKDTGRNRIVLASNPY